MSKITKLILAVAFGVMSSVSIASNSTILTGHSESGTKCWDAGSSSNGYVPKEIPCN